LKGKKTESEEKKVALPGNYYKSWGCIQISPELRRVRKEIVPERTYRNPWEAEIRS